jgi:hypothetical protein
MRQPEQRPQRVSGDRDLDEAMTFRWYTRPLWAVLSAMAEQVGRSRKERFASADLTLGDLAMAFKEEDDGILGDAFEWAVWRAIREHDPVITELVITAAKMRDAGFSPNNPTAVMVAAERQQFAEVVAEAGPNAVLRAARGRPPLLSNVLKGATRKNWKADLLIGDVDGHWLPASLKARRSLLRDASPEDPTLLKPPQIGITAARPVIHGRSARANPHISFNDHGLPIVEVPLDKTAYVGLEAVRREVMDGMSQDFAPSAKSGFQLPWQVALRDFLYRRLNQPLSDVLLELQLLDPLKEHMEPAAVDSEADLLWKDFDGTALTQQPTNAVITTETIVASSPWS